MDDEVEELLHEEELEPEELDEEGVPIGSLLEEEGEEAAEEAEEIEEVAEAEEAAVAEVEVEVEEEPEEVEASLDEILRERFEGEVAEYEEEEEEEEALLLPRTGEEIDVKPRTAEEFVCSSCFLVKHRRQLADPVRSICADCANPQ